MTTPAVDEDELAELVDGYFPRVDLVGKSANGAPRFLIAKGAHGNNGLMEATVVRALISKATESGLTQAVFSQSGKLLGAIDPKDLMPLTTGDEDEPVDAAPESIGTPAEAPPTAPAPLPPHSATPAQAIAKAAALQEGTLSPGGMVLAVLHNRGRHVEAMSGARRRYG